MTRRLCALSLQGGDLRNALWRELHEGTHEFDWYNKGRDVAIAVARGLNFLHKNHVVHRCRRLFGGVVSEATVSKCPPSGRRQSG